ILVQLGGVLAPLEPYYAVIFEVFTDDPLDGLYNRSTWQLQYTQWYLSLTFLADHPFDLAWTYSENGWIGAVLGAVLTSFSLVGWVASQYFNKPYTLLVAWVLTICLMTFGYGAVLT